MRKTVLIIEDNEQNIYLMDFILRNAGFEVIQARDGASGIDKALEASPDLILLDIQLPGMDGYAVAGKLREADGLREAPIVAVTSYAMVGDKEKALAAGCTGYIEKPINPETFIAEISRFIEPANAKE
ncbi:MAG: response regulator [Proteobacteria bacterium]|nr:response regulator [Pseudomonadota bacterium]